MLRYGNSHTRTQVLAEASKENANILTKHVIRTSGVGRYDSIFKSKSSGRGLTLSIIQQNLNSWSPWAKLSKLKIRMVYEDRDMCVQLRMINMNYSQSTLEKALNLWGVIFWEILVWPQFIPFKTYGIFQIIYLHGIIIYLPVCFFIVIISLPVYINKHVFWKRISLVFHN